MPSPSKRRIVLAVLGWSCGLHLTACGDDAIVRPAVFSATGGTAATDTQTAVSDAGPVADHGAPDAGRSADFGLPPEADADPDATPGVDGLPGADFTPAPDVDPLPEGDLGAEPQPDASVSSDTEPSADTAPDTGPDIANPCPGAPSCPCKVQADCKTGLCIVNAAGAQVCGNTCDAKVKPIESCNGIDDDCDGATDEGTCEDGNSCTADSCTGALGCKTVSAPGPCSDGSVCSQGDSCANGACLAGPNLNCNDNNPCTSEMCAADKGCQIQAQAGPCDDGNACTYGEACAAASCQGGFAVQCTKPGVCTTTTCDQGKGCVTTPTAGFCQDGNACTSGDACSGSACLPGAIANCDDQNPCTADGCDKDKGCTHSATAAPCSDGSQCTQTDQCQGGVCAGGAPVNCKDSQVCTVDTCDPAKGCVFAPVAGACSDNNLCTGGEACANGGCAGGKAVACDDLNPCTSDSCATDTGCVFAPNTAACSDGDACTIKDVCGQGGCLIGKPLSCNDNKPCTTDSCSPATGCVFAANTAACDDGNACTGTDGCKAGQCAAGSPIVCDDKKPCTFDTCDAAKGCMAINLALPCDDGSVCTVGDVCKDGQCGSGTAVTCNDGNPCTSDACDKAKGCTVTPNSAPCTDNNACTGGDTCKSGACNGAQLACNDTNLCTDDYCDAAKGCQTVANALACNDNTACTHNDGCKSGTCAGAAVDCDDKNPCTTDTCDASKGCVHSAVANNTKCGDVGVCLVGACSPGADINPALTCKAIKAAWAAAPTGTYWLDPDGFIGAGAKYQAKCDMVAFGGGWMVIDNQWAFKLLTMTNVNPTQGKCQLTASEWRTWDGFDGAPGSTHFCLAEKVSKNWPTYTELRYDGLQLIGYTGGGNNVFDLGLDCYGTIYVGGFCAGPLAQLVPPNTTSMTLGNGVKSPVFNKTQVFASPVADFQIRSREEGPQLEGVVWNTGAILLR
ncbi:MAG: hypothetical protein EXR77_13510 [Myxococcales bacterium]|nr:hypothetical protein [Myxococcales bacterium]